MTEWNDIIEQTRELRRTQREMPIEQVWTRSSSACPSRRGASMDDRSDPTFRAICDRMIARCDSMIGLCNEMLVMIERLKRQRDEAQERGFGSLEPPS